MIEQNFSLNDSLTQRSADNVRSSRLQISSDAIELYFQNLSETLEGIPEKNIFNYDETNVTDDPSRKKCVVRRGLARIERKAEHSKQSVSIMFSGNAVGEYLPPMVVYKAKNVYEGWMIGGPKGTIYNSTPSGWFDMKTFEKWFFEIFLKSSNKMGGPKVIIGDNLGCHFSPKVIETCLQKDIRFITLVPNTTHLCQPLDLAVFRPLKTSWRELLNEWRRETRLTGTIPKEVIPKLLNRAFVQLKIEHIVAGFRGCGIVPVNKEEVFKWLPGKSKDTGNEDSIKNLNESSLSLLKEHCGIGLLEKFKRKKRGKNVQPGKPVTLEDFMDEENDQALELMNMFVNMFVISYIRKTHSC